MKWIGQHIVDQITRLRSDVYLEGASPGRLHRYLGLDSNGLISTVDLQYINILPHHFLQNNEGGVNKSILYDDSGTIGVKSSSSNAELYAFVDLPIGMQAETVTIFGSDSANVVNIYEANVNASGLTDRTPGGGCTVNSVCTLSGAITGDATKYLVVKVSTTATNDIVYGGQIMTYTGGL